MEKFPIFDRNHRLTLLEKSQFFNFFGFLILESKKTFFSFQNIIKHFLLADFANNKKMENFQIFDQNHGVTPLEKCQFLDFLTFCFLQYKKAFFLSRILSNTVSFLILPKIIRWKMFKFYIKTMDYPLWKNPNSLTFFNFLILEAKNTFFLSRISSNTFCWLILPIIKKMENFQVFDQNHGGNPFWKNANIWTFLTFCFLQYKKLFSFQNIVKHIFLSDFAKNKKMEKFQIFYQNHGLSPLEKSRFFDFFNFLILESEKAFFPSQNIFKHVFLSDFDKNKIMEKFPIFERNHRLTPFEKS